MFSNKVESSSVIGTNRVESYDYMLFRVYNETSFIKMNERVMRMLRKFLFLRENCPECPDQDRHQYERVTLSGRRTICL